MYNYVSQHLFWMRAYRREADTWLASAHGVVDPEAAARRLRAHLVQQYTAGLMTAKCLVGLAWFITQAGGRGVEDLSHDPASLHRNAARICVKTLGLQLIKGNCLWECLAHCHDRAFRKNKCCKL